MATALQIFALIASAQTTADSIIKREVTTTQAYETLEYLTDNIGQRLSGSTNAAAAVRWATGTFEKWGIAVTNEKVMVPHWVRGVEDARLVSHRNQQIILTALGGSIATPATGITADVVEASSFDELKTAKVKGKIVFYNNPMDMDLVRAHRSFDAYRKAVVFRGEGASRAAEAVPTPSGKAGLTPQNTKIEFVCAHVAAKPDPRKGGFARWRYDAGQC